MPLEVAYVGLIANAQAVWNACWTEPMRSAWCGLVAGALFVALAAGCGSGADDQDGDGSVAEPSEGAGAVTALDERGGTRWSVQASGARLTAIDVASGVVLAWGSDECDRGARLEAFDSSDGTKRWEHETRLDGYGPFSVTTGDGAVLVPSDRSVTALEVADGSTRWTATLPVTTDIPLAADDEMVLVGEQWNPMEEPGPDSARERRARLTALDAATGKAVWSISLAPGIQLVDVAPFPDTVVTEEWGPVSGGGSPQLWLRGYARPAGNLRWEQEIGTSERLRRLESAAGTVVVALDLTAWQTREGEPLPSTSSVTGVNALTGERQWVVERDGDSMSRTGIALLDADDTTVVVMDEGELKALAAATGNEIWSSRVAADAATIVTGGVVAGGDRLTLLDLKTGTRRWSRPDLPGRAPAATAAAGVVLARSGSIPGGCLN